MERFPPEACLYTQLRGIKIGFCREESGPTDLKKRFEWASQSTNEIAGFMVRLQVGPYGSQLSVRGWSGDLPQRTTPRLINNPCSSLQASYVEKFDVAFINQRVQ